MNRQLLIDRIQDFHCKFCVASSQDRNVTLRSCHITSYWLETIKSLSLHRSGFPPRSFSQPFPFFLFFALLRVLFSYISLFFLSSCLLSGHASDPSVIFLYAFYLKFFSLVLLFSFTLWLTSTYFCMMSVKRTAASINGSVSDLKKALSS